MGSNEGVKQAGKQQKDKQQAKKKSPHMQGVLQLFQLDRTLLGGFPVKSEVILI